MSITPILTVESTPDELAEILEGIDECRSISAAEAGMSALANGFDAYDGMNEYTAGIQASDWELEARARVAEAFPPRVYVGPVIDTSDDLPF
jgi:hypothetical protein